MLTAPLRSLGAGPGVLPLPRADDRRVRGGKAGGVALTARRARVLRAGRTAAIGNFGRYDATVRTILMSAGAALILAGLVWLAQGLNLPFAPRSFMTADRSWAFIGAVAAVAGAALLVRARRMR